MNDSVQKPVMHPATAALLKGVVTSPPNSLGLVGLPGIGRKTLAEWIVRNLVDDPALELDENQYCKVIATENDISIKREQIKSILDFVKLKTIGKKNLRRFVVIDNADILTRDAQSALLKLLEEPPLDTMIILLINNPQELHDTVLSRLQLINIRKPSKELVREHFKVDPKDFDKLYVLAEGLPGLLQSIIDDPESHSLILSLAKVRSLLAKTTYERLLIVNELSADKNEVKILLDVLSRLSKVSIDAAVDKGDVVAANKWLKILEGSAKAKDALNRNAKPKLTLTDLFLNLV